MIKPSIKYYKTFWEQNDPYDNLTLKQCQGCNGFLSRSNFTKCKTLKDGLQRLCKSCKKEDQMIRRKTNKIFWLNNNPYHNKQFKKCYGQCKQNKSRDNFGKALLEKDGLQRECKDCRKISSKTSSCDPRAKMIRIVKNRAKKKKMNFNITIHDIVIPNICPVFGIPLFIVGGKQTDNSPSLDRIDNSKGYEKGNVKVISWKANRLKNEATLNELKLIIQYIKCNSIEF